MKYTLKIYWKNLWFNLAIALSKRLPDQWSVFQTKLTVISETVSWLLNSDSPDVTKSLQCNHIPSVISIRRRRILNQTLWYKPNVRCLGSRSKEHPRESHYKRDTLCTRRAHTAFFGKIYDKTCSVAWQIWSLIEVNRTKSMGTQSRWMGYFLNYFCRRWAGILTLPLHGFQSFLENFIFNCFAMLAALISWPSQNIWKCKRNLLHSPNTSIARDPKYAWWEFKGQTITLTS